jgi:hypothetical protein
MKHKTFIESKEVSRLGVTNTVEVRVQGGSFQTLLCGDLCVWFFINDLWSQDFVTILQDEIHLNVHQKQFFKL